MAKWNPRGGSGHISLHGALASSALRIAGRTGTLTMTSGSPTPVMAPGSRLTPLAKGQEEKNHPLHPASAELLMPLDNDPGTAAETTSAMVMGRLRVKALTRCSEVPLDDMEGGCWVKGGGAGGGGGLHTCCSILERARNSKASNEARYSSNRPGSPHLLAWPNADARASPSDFRLAPTSCLLFSSPCAPSPVMDGQGACGLERSRPKLPTWDCPEWSNLNPDQCASWGPLVCGFAEMSAIGG
ncbi:unnamed protein product [Pleuronectes platessa]|uniref:Uncharacterized protein n=1 Tax=Pleuronectes platessa TaxID=8262 RepID=A0A9N7UUP9_PLEPL|nr:unnamed protein product [Pleuronectes platessa]